MASEHVPDQFEQRSDTREWRGSAFPFLEILERWLASHGLDAPHREALTCEARHLLARLPVSVRLTIFKKLFLQPGSGRAESALYRGMDQAARFKVQAVLDVLEAEGVVYSTHGSGGTIWHGRSNSRQQAQGVSTWG